VAEKRPLWDAEDRLSATDAVGVRTLQAAVAAYEQALEEQPAHPPARRGLCGLYATEVRRARERRDPLNRIYFEELVKQYSDGGPAPSQEGRLIVEASGGRVQAFVAEYEEEDRRLRPVREIPLGLTPIGQPLPAGSYRLRLTAGGNAVTLTASIVAGETCRVAVDLDVIAALLPDERYVPGGPALLGGDELSPFGPERVTIDVPAFIACTYPVTFAEYLEFLEALRARGAALEPYLSTSALGTPNWRWDGRRFVPAESFALTREEMLALPAFGVTREAASAYATWRAEKTGRAYRLLFELEWEKAARGTDGRIYPWGDAFDASFCKMYQSRPGSPRPEPPGTFPSDVSPYGIADLAGSIAEWVNAPAAPDENLDVSRGGAWCDFRPDCRASARRPYQAGARTSRVAFRLARDV
jgi:serine/threonine-protein kinase